MRKLFTALLFFITFVSIHAQTVWTGNVELDWGNTTIISSSNFSSVSNGKNLNLKITKTKNDYQSFKIYDGSWKELNKGNFLNALYSGQIVPKFTSNTIVISYSLTSEEFNNIKKNGLLIHGYGVKLTEIAIGNNSSVVISTSSTTEKTGTNIGATGSTTENIWVGNVELSWSATTIISSSKFNSISSGESLTFKVTKSKNDYQNIKIYDGSWKELTGGTYSNAKYTGAIVPNFSSNTITISYSLTSENVNNLKKNGLIIHGYGVKLTEISAEKLNNNSSSNSSSVVVSTSSTNTGTTATSSVSTKTQPTVSSGTPFSKHGKLHVSGGNLFDEHNQKFMLYGMSTHGLNFGNEFSRYVNKDAFKTLRDDWNTNCIRLVLYPGDYNGYCNGGNKNTLKQIVKNGINYATELGMYVLVDWHVHNFNPNDRYKEDAKAFLAEIAKEYAKYDNVLYEICNEPTGAPWNSSIKPYAEAVIPSIRQYAKNAVIIVGTNTWSQDIQEAYNNPLDPKKYGNIMYTFHFYAQSHTHLFSRVEEYAKKGLPIFITEFGTCDASGNGGFTKQKSKKWLELCKKYNISHLNWSLSNKGETASAIQSWCNKTSAWSDGDLTESGKFIKEHFKGIRN